MIDYLLLCFALSLPGGTIVSLWIIPATVIDDHTVYCVLESLCVCVSILLPRSSLWHSEPRPCSTASCSL